MNRVDEMVQLCGQIRAGHQARRDFGAKLARSGAARRYSVHTHRTAIRAANQARRRGLGESLGGFMSALTAAENARRQEAHRAYQARTQFLNGVRQNCAAMARDCNAMRHANRAESAASRAAFFGMSHAAPSGKRAGKSGSAA